MKVGVVGIGYWGRKVVKEYAQLLDENYIDYLGLCDYDESKLRDFREYETFTDFNELLKKVDAVHICTNNETHYELSRKALEEGVHVLVEKPMTTNRNHAFNLIELAYENGVILQVGHIYRFANVIKKVRELYQSNFFGDVYYINLTWSHLMAPMEKVDILWDLLPHPLDILNFVTKKWPDTFLGIGRAFRRNRLNEVASLQAVFEDRFFANIHLSWLTPVRRRTMEIVGSERSAIVECVEQKITIYENEGGTRQLYVEPNNTIREEIINFIEAIRTGKNNFNSAIIGLRTIELIEEALNSLR
ncbi:MAG: UDP-N-acetylglucosamine 3-dehydrogenase [Pyrococcus sp.]|uniref:Gfo/Idh/MocA family protein n=1 Tax=Pyrococcus sp. TaxID=33866 RepID=UPI0018110FF8|nr:Gfo/Idh/MocA family oxidoreductase [Pyrococcus sp.]MDK2870580.1 UDP-N-acetylglucosamine 3-dehydrogenase [Pyrococcus sp.]HIH72544.1 Gfo/Idh/MocA family oxidoreductase [Thermococcaceae archaeon]